MFLSVLNAPLLRGELVAHFDAVDDGEEDEEGEAVPRRQAVAGRLLLLRRPLIHRTEEGIRDCIAIFS